MTSVSARVRRAGQPRPARDAARRRTRATRSPRSAGRWKPVPQPRSSTTRPAQSARARMASSSRPSRSTAWFSSSYVAGCCQMFGLGTAPRGRPRSRLARTLASGPSGSRRRRLAARRSDPDQPVRGLELGGDDARRAVGGDPLDLDVLERRLDGLAQPLADPLRVAGDLEAGQRPVGAAAGRRVQLVGAQPLR